MTKGSPDDEKRFVSIKGARVAPSSTKGDLFTFSGKTVTAVIGRLFGLVAVGGR
ncbi:MAG: hypothetical protein ACLPX5_01010 [Dissulfurispiraceae bacterium]